MLLMCLLAVPELTAFAQWQWLNPKPQGNDLVAVDFISADTGYALGWRGPIMKTTDGGLTWDIPCDRDFNTGDYTLNNLDFLDADTGYIVGNHVILKTTDGGQSWISLTGSYQPVLYYEPQFFDTRSGYVYGNYIGGASGGIYKTVDGGLNWTVLSCPWGATAMHFFNPDTGWVASYDGLFRTTDGCSSWVKKSTEDVFYYEVFFYNTMLGWARGGFNNEFFRTTDGGETWIETHIGSWNFEYNEIFFIDELTGWMAGYEKDPVRVRKSTDGGVTWLECLHSNLSALKSMCVLDENRIWAVGTNGWIFRTSDGGSSWDTLSSGTRNKINTIITTQAGATGDVDTIWAVGSGGLMMQTTDGGNNWTIFPLGTGNELMDICFTDLNTGYVTGYDDAIYKSTDGGGTWSFLPIGQGMDFTALFFIDADSGWMTTNDGRVVKTDNGGQTWQEVTVAPGCRLNDICFTNGSHGIATGIDGNDYGHYYTTLDGGETWSSSLIYHLLYKVKFLNDSVGWMLAKDRWYENESFIMKTTDKGVTWHKSQKFGPKPADFTFINESVGWVVGELGWVLSTTNGGSSWNPEEKELTLYGLTSCFATGLRDLWIAGQKGTIARLCADTLFFDVPDQDVNTSSDLKIIPNPFRECAQIQFESDGSTPVIIDIFDLFGRSIERKKLENYTEGPGYQFCRNHRPPGIYLIRVQTGGKVICGKMVLTGD